MLGHKPGLALVHLLPGSSGGAPLSEWLLPVQRGRPRSRPRSESPDAAPHFLQQESKSLEVETGAVRPHL